MSIEFQQHFIDTYGHSIRPSNIRELDQEDEK